MISLFFYFLNETIPLVPQVYHVRTIAHSSFQNVCVLKILSILKKKSFQNE